MKKTLKGYLLGFLSAAILVSGVTYAANTVRIVIDNKELIPTDVNGNRVDPIIIDGTTYLPVRAIADAFGKSVYWDGPNSTVYLGDMNGALKYPTAMLKDVENINGESSWSFKNVDNDVLIDNYGNSYSNAIGCARDATFETLLNGKYSKFKGTLYIPQDYIVDKSIRITIGADGHQIYSSPQMNKTSRPVEIDIDISNYNDFKIIYSADYSQSYNWECQALCIGDAGFYQ
ncbi:MAG: NPCBM/NEW2 domain-containing protein [Clostridia bacterium]|nr:NPCBM/NEW2 domain-containing protein [Clostridia bacterium]